MFSLNLNFKPAGVSIQSGGNEPCTDYFGAKMGFSRVSGGHTCKLFFLVSLCSVCKHLHCHCNFHCHFTCFPLFTFLQTTRFFMGLVFLESGAWYKVNRCLARYSPRVTTTNQPTNSAPNEPARPICAQESVFWGKNWPFLGQKP